MAQDCLISCANTRRQWQCDYIHWATFIHKALPLSGRAGRQILSRKTASGELIAIIFCVTDGFNLCRNVTCQRTSCLSYWFYTQWELGLSTNILNPNIYLNIKNVDLIVKRKIIFNCGKKKKTSTAALRGVAFAQRLSWLKVRRDNADGGKIKWNSRKFRAQLGSRESGLDSKLTPFGNILGQYRQKCSALEPITLHGLVRMWSANRSIKKKLCVVWHSYVTEHS